MRLTWLILIALISAMVRPAAHAEPPTRDVVFASPDGHDLKLDLFLPQDVENPPLVVFIHGGGWRNYSYKRCLTPWLTEYGFAVASVGYRLSGVAKFPAQVHDCKAAVRWLRAHADEYGYNTHRIGVAGASAGGHLALMLGVTSDVEKLNGDVGDYFDQSSQVHAIVDYFGPSDFVLRSQNQPVKTEPPGSHVRELLGVPASQHVELAKFASPAFHITPGDPPLLILHGDQDDKVFLDQSQRMVDEYRQHKLDVTLEIVPGGGHGGKEYFKTRYREQVAAFFKQHLQTESGSGE